MKERRYEASSVVDENDNLWVIGGTDDSKGSGMDRFVIDSDIVCITLL